MSADFKLPRSTPEEQGISSKVVEEFLSALDKLRFPNSFMLMRNGFVIAEGWWKPYSPDVRHQLFSLSKSFVSMAVGLAIEEGRLKLDAPVVDFFPEKLPQGMQDSFNRMTVRHLLTMSSGHGACPLWQMLNAADGDCIKTFFSSHLDFEPGTRFIYNSAATYMLSAIVSKLAGMDLVDYLNPRLLLPLGIKNARWDTCPKGICIGGWGFHLTTEEIANFAQMLLDNGKWNGRQLIPTKYLEMATAFQIDNSMNESPDWKLGYGFQFWRSQHNAFRGDGAFGQYALAIPELNMALASTSGLSNMQSVLTLVWDILLPAAGKNPLRDDPAALKSLRQRASALRIPMSQGEVKSAILQATFEIKANDIGMKKIRFDFSRGLCSIAFETENSKETLNAGFGKNILDDESLFYKKARKVAASASWKDSHCLEITCCYYETPFIVTFTCHFEGAALRFESSSNLKFATTDWPLLEGIKCD